MINPQKNLSMRTGLETKRIWHLINTWIRYHKNKMCNHNPLLIPSILPKHKSIFLLSLYLITPLRAKYLGKIQTIQIWWRNNKNNHWINPIIIILTYLLPLSNKMLHVTPLLILEEMINSMLINLFHTNLSGNLIVRMYLLKRRVTKILLNSSNLTPHFRKTIMFLVLLNQFQINLIVFKILKEITTNSIIIKTIQIKIKIPITCAQAAAVQLQRWRISHSKCSFLLIIITTKRILLIAIQSNKTQIIHRMIILVITPKILNSKNNSQINHQNRWINRVITIPLFNLSTIQILMLPPLSLLEERVWMIFWMIYRLDLIKRINPNNYHSSSSCSIHTSN